MKRILPFLLFLTILTNCNDTSEKEKEQQLLNERIARIEDGVQSVLEIQMGDSTIVNYYNIEDRMKELEIPGLSIAVMYNGEVEWAKGYGMADSSENRKVTSKTLFQAGSISKPVAATRAHQLTEEGKMSLDNNVNDYLTSWKLPDTTFTENEKVTLRRMLNHTAGLTIWGFPGYSRTDTIPSVTDILDGKGNTGAVRVYKEPGGDWQYSGGGYTIMQLMVTDTDNKAFEDTMQEHVLNPLGMTSSTYENPLPEKYHGLAATGYLRDGSAVEGKWHIYPEMAAAGLWTTPSQLVLWSGEIQDILQTQRNDGILKAETVNEMLTGNDDDQGLGPYVVEHIFGHGGADEGFRAELKAWKELPITVAIMSNSDNGGRIFDEVFLSIAKEYDLPGIEPRKRTYTKQSKESLERFVGEYDFPDRSATITLKDDGLEFVGGPADAPIYLLPEDDTTYFSSKTGLYFNFEVENDIVTGLKVSRYEVKKIN
ncbi:MAG: serine hydrolase domain-containing protein [Bacteroidota bacterium]